VRVKGGTEDDKTAEALGLYRLQRRACVRNGHTSKDGALEGDGKNWCARQRLQGETILLNPKKRIAMQPAYPRVESIQGGRAAFRNGWGRRLGKTAGLRKKGGKKKRRQADFAKEGDQGIIRGGKGHNLRSFLSFHLRMSFRGRRSSNKGRKISVTDGETFRRGKRPCKG